VYVDLAQALVDARRPDEAIAHLRDGIASYPDSAELHYTLGAILTREGRPEEAAELLRRARALAPEGL
jgi:Flp pilus assembly protein TadD